MSNVRPHQMPRIKPCSRLPLQPTHAQVVADYIANYRNVLRAELGWFAQSQPDRAAIRRAAAATGANGKRMSHQYRLLTSVIPESTLRLVANAPTLMAAPTFAALYSEVAQSLRGIRGAGALYKYDTALRIASFRRLRPSQVYLQAGAAAGARNLFKRPVRGPLPILHFPPAFRVLRAHEIENLLCLYADCL
jgi:hypothetical protein